jgi:triacylglycerol lipase
VLNDRLVVLISGWSKPDFLWWPMTRRFEDCGYDVMRLQFPHRGLGAIEECAMEAHPVLLAAKEHYEHLIVVGHSMGGLIGRYLIQVLGLEADAYVSIATPHHGTMFGKYALFSQSAQQMDRDSEFLKTLNSLPWPSDLPTLALQAQFEEIVWPSSSTEFENAVNVKVDRSLHGSIILKEQTFLEIWAWLTWRIFNNENPPIVEGISSVVKLNDHR